MIVVDQIVDAGLISLLLYGLQKMQSVAPTSFGVRKMFKQMMPVPYGLGTMDGTLMIALILLLAHLFTRPMGAGSRKFKKGTAGIPPELDRSKFGWSEPEKFIPERGLYDKYKDKDIRNMYMGGSKPVYSVLRGQ